jgi:hypothetical protein
VAGDRTFASPADNRFAVDAQEFGRAVGVYKRFEFFHVDCYPSNLLRRQQGISGFTLDVF